MSGLGFFGIGRRCGVSAVSMSLEVVGEKPS